MTTDTSSRMPSAADFIDPETAINFALDMLEPFEVSEFLRERRNGEDLTPWIEGAEKSRTLASGQ